MSTIRDQVLEFHRAFGQPVLPAPTTPGDERVRLRASLVVEECLEFLDACFDPISDCGPGSAYEELEVGRTHLLRAIARAKVKLNLVQAADALADIDYVVEGSRLEFGIDGTPIAAEVHRSNMAKLGGPTSPEGKKLKPPGWTPPDIEGCLRAQGYFSRPGGAP